jgi:5-methylcytosine-specific restriction endonuclease McrA
MKRMMREMRPRLRLAPEEYEKLSVEILKRDSWKCQDCGLAPDLEVRHITARSRLGDDCERNLITLCSCCLRYRHRIDFQAGNLGSNST